MTSNSKDLKNSKFERILAGIESWIAYFRQNIHIFAEMYLGIKLKTFQKIVLYEMNKCSNTVFISSRGIGKTFLTALFSTCRAILYPGTTIVVASKTRKQAKGVIDKINDIFLVESPLLKNEIAEIKLNQYDTEVKFVNGSKIFVCTANDNSRGYRANILIVDEYRLVDPTVISTVLKKFLTAPRHCGFQDKPEYADYIPEQNKEIYLSSAWYKASPAYETFKSCAANMLSGRVSSFCCALPYQLAIKEKLLTEDRVLSDMLDKSTFSEISWKMEMEALFWSGVDGALYQFDTIEPSRTIKYSFYPKSSGVRFLDKRMQIPPKLSGEKRILSADLALMSSNKTNNDASSIFINQMLPRGKDDFTYNIVYTENNEGMRSDALALAIRRLFEEFECDYLVIDSRGLGLPIVDLIMADMYDNETGNVYKALSCCNNPDIADRCMVKDAPKVIWSVMGSPEFNSNCALGLREAFRKNQLRLLSTESDMEEYLSELKGYQNLSLEEQLKIKLPYIHTSLLVNELINLEYEAKNNVIRVKEKTGMRKDRYSSLSYNIYVANQIMRDVQVAKAKKNVRDLVFEFRAPILKK